MGVLRVNVGGTWVDIGGSIPQGSSGLEANRPAASTLIAGMHYFATDTLRDWLCDGTSWSVAAATGPWTPYTPNVTAATTNPNIGTTGSRTGAYIVLGKTMHWRAIISSAGTGIAPGSGQYYISHPPVPLATLGQITGHGWMYGALGFVPVVSDNSPGRLIRTDIANTYVNESSGFTGVGHVLNIDGTVEVA